MATRYEDGNGSKNILHGTQTYRWENLTANTIYYFEIYPYTNTGNDINYKTDGSVPAVSDSTGTIPSDTLMLLISEVVDPSNQYKARYVELYNASSDTIDFSSTNWYLCRQANGSATSWGDIHLTGTVAAGAAFTVAYSSSEFTTAYGFAPDMTSGYISGNGNDGYFLYYGGNHSSGILIDAYGEIDVNGTGTVSIRIVADCVVLSCQVTRKLKRATTLYFTTISAIIFIHCYRLVFIHFSHFFFQFATVSLSAVRWGRQAF